MASDLVDATKTANPSIISISNKWRWYESVSYRPLNYPNQYSTRCSLEWGQEIGSEWPTLSAVHAPLSFSTVPSIYLLNDLRFGRLWAMSAYVSKLLHRSADVFFKELNCIDRVCANIGDLLRKSLSHGAFPCLLQVSPYFVACIYGAA